MMPPDIREMLKSILASLPEEKKPSQPSMQLEKPQEHRSCPACEMEAEGKKPSMPHEGCDEADAEEEASNKVVVLLLSGEDE